MTEPTAGSRIAQTFAYVADVYAETAVLMKDLKAALTLKGFTSLTGNANGHNGSRSLDWPRQWLPRYVTGLWVPDNLAGTGRKSDNCLAASVIFFDLEDQAVDPVLVYGMITIMDHPQATFQNWWLWDVYFNRDKAFSYIADAGGPAWFQCEKYRRDSYLWPCSGAFTSRPLTDIVDITAVRQLADEMASLWASACEEGNAGEEGQASEGAALQSQNTLD